MELEQRYVIKLFVQEGMKQIEVIDRLDKHYDRNAPSESKCIAGSRR
jgi:hypothetical protein